MNLFHIFFLINCIIIILISSFCSIKKESKKEYYQKGQFTRLIDVLILGPFMIRFGLFNNGLEGYVMILAGVSTIFYNGYNFLGIYTKGKIPPLPI